MSHLKDHGADQSIDRPGEGFGDTGSLETPQHDATFAEDREEIEHLDARYLDGEKKTRRRNMKPAIKQIVLETLKMSVAPLETSKSHQIIFK